MQEFPTAVDPSQFGRPSEGLREAHNCRNPAEGNNEFHDSRDGFVHHGRNGLLHFPDGRFRNLNLNLANIEFLRRAGLDFARHASEGIDPSLLAWGAMLAPQWGWAMARKRAAPPVRGGRPPSELGFSVGGFWRGSAGVASVASGGTCGPSSP